MQVIGYIQSCYPEKFGTPRQPGLAASSWAKINIDPKLQPENALRGLEGFSHLWVIFNFHKNTNERYHAKIHPPRLRGESIGVFATRSPHRPNPIGLSLVEIEKIENNSIIIKGSDLIDGTPVLDIKPYLPEIEAKPFAKSGWTDRVEPNQIEVIFSDNHLSFIENWSKEINQPQLGQMIEETLSLDPRPLVYKGYEGSESPYRQEHAVRFFDGDVHFKFINSNQIQIIKICKFMVTNKQAVD